MNFLKIRENITPTGDGKNIKFISSFFKLFTDIPIRENITPRGDGNSFYDKKSISFYNINIKK